MSVVWLATVVGALAMVRVLAEIVSTLRVTTATDAVRPTDAGLWQRAARDET